MERKNPFSLAGKKALIAFPEAPYGAEIAQGLLEAGAEVFLCGAELTALKAVAKVLKQAGCQVSWLLEYRPGTEAAAAELAAKAKSAMGQIDIFAYIDPGIALKGWDHGFQEISDNLHVTQTGLMLTVKHIGMAMAEQGAGSVLFVSDYAALVGCDAHNYDEAPEAFDEAFSIDYGFVKGSYVNYARQAAGYLGEHNIRCNCIACTPLAGKMPAGFEQAFIRHSHLKRMASPGDVKAAAVFLASDASAYITGVTLPVDGGYTAK
jgi:NAD(P)-dependent dehydrogenase (short-subunit alcohol dehydrogenase family)